MFLIGLCSQKYLGPFTEDEIVYGGGGGGEIAVGGSTLEKRRRALFTPPRTRSTAGGSAIALPSSKPVTRSSTGSTSSDFEVEDTRAAGAPCERQPAFGSAGGERGDAGDDHGRGLEGDDDDDDPREYDEDEAFILGLGGGKRRSGGGVWERATAGARG